MSNPQNKQPRIEIICPCGNAIQTTQKRLDSGRGRFCSYACKYKYKVMPKRGKGTYNLVKDNAGWFAKGIVTWTAINKGNYKIDPSKIKKGVHRSPNTEFKKGENINDKNSNWKGDLVGYMALHTWIARKYGKADVCEKCSSENTVEWANISREYKRDITDWIKLCKKCHGEFDSGENWGKATKKFNLNKKEKK